jgi:hypothetical protein
MSFYHCISTASHLRYILNKWILLWVEKMVHKFRRCSFCWVLRTEEQGWLGACWWLMSILLVTWEAEIERIVVWGHPGQIVLETPSPNNNQSKVEWRCGSSGMVPPLQVWSPDLTETKWTGCVVQAVECLLCKCKVLSSNASPTKKNPPRLESWFCNL